MAVKADAGGVTGSATGATGEPEAGLGVSRCAAASVLAIGKFDPFKGPVNEGWMAQPTPTQPNAGSQAGRHHTRQMTS